MKVQMGIDVDYIYCSKLPMKHRHQYFDDEPKAPKQKQENAKSKRVLGDNSALAFRDRS